MSTTIARDTLIAQRVLVRDLPDRSRIVATLRIHQLGGNTSAHFSATADIYDAHGTHSGAVRQRMGREMDGGGAAHGAILRAFPGAEAFVRMHLSEYPTGIDMHALANGAYYLSGKSDTYQEAHGYWWQSTGLAAFCRSWRLDDPRDIPHRLARAYQNREWDDAAQEELTRFYEEQKPRWAAEARAARDLLDLMPNAIDLRGYDMRGEPVKRMPLPSWLIGADPEHVDI